MVDVEPFVYLNKVNIYDQSKLAAYFHSLLFANINNKEGFLGHENSDGTHIIRYFKIINSFDLAFDNDKEKIISEETPKVIKGEIRLNYINETMIIWGRPKIIKAINNTFQSPKPFEIIESPMNFKSVYKQLTNHNCNITEISFKDIRLMSKYIPLANFKTTSNNDAIELISNLGAKLTSTKIEVFSSTTDDSVELDINLEDSIIKLQFNSIGYIFIEEIKDIIDNLQLI